MAFEKGKSGNPGGLSKEQRKARDELRGALAKDSKKVHGALMKLVRKGNSQAIVYAHQLLHGKEGDVLSVEHSGSIGGLDYSKLSDDELRTLKTLLETASVADEGSNSTTH